MKWLEYHLLVRPTKRRAYVRYAKASQDHKADILYHVERIKESGGAYSEALYLTHAGNACAKNVQKDGLFYLIQAALRALVQMELTDAICPEAAKTCRESLSLTHAIEKANGAARLSASIDLLFVFAFLLESHVLKQHLPNLLSTFPERFQSLISKLEIAAGIPVQKEHFRSLTEMLHVEQNRIQ